MASHQARGRRMAERVGFVTPSYDRLMLLGTPKMFLVINAPFSFERKGL